MAIAIPTVGSEISAETFGAPVAQKVNDLTPTAWTAVPTTYSPWANVQYNMPAQYRRVGDEVQLRGLLYNPSASGTNVVLVPVGFRPTQELRIALGCTGGINNMMCVGMSVDGVLKAYPATGGWPSYLFLDGFRFSILAA
jgi:hypothetical protein